MPGFQKKKKIAKCTRADKKTQFEETEQVSEPFTDKAEILEL